MQREKRQEILTWHLSCKKLLATSISKFLQREQSNSKICVLAIYIFKSCLLYINLILNNIVNSWEKYYFFTLIQGYLISIKCKILWKTRQSDNTVLHNFVLKLTSTFEKNHFSMSFVWSPLCDDTMMILMNVDR